MSETDKRAQLRAERRLKLIRQLNDMLTVPDISRIEIVLNYRSRLIAFETLSSPLTEAQADDLRHLIADLATNVAVLEHLAVLFENVGQIRAFLAEAKCSLVHLVQAWQRREKPARDDIDTLDVFIELLSDALKLTRLAEYKDVLLLVEKELKRD